MAVNARLSLDSLKDVRVIDFSYNFNRDIDASGRPSGMVRGGTVQITVGNGGSAGSEENDAWSCCSRGKRCCRSSALSQLLGIRVP